MALSDIVATAVKISTVTATLDKRATDKAGFRSDVASLLHTRFPNVTLAQAVAGLTSGEVVVVVDPQSGCVGFGRSVSDACDAITAKVGP